MKFRYARHTNNLEELRLFYTEIIGLRELGGFKNHNNYNGTFLGFPNHDWHIEFTESLETVKHSPDEDDLLVFYLDSEYQLSDILKRAKFNDIPIVKSQNPYWITNGIELKDPDGFGIILSVQKANDNN